MIAPLLHINNRYKTVNIPEYCVKFALDAYVIKQYIDHI